MSGSDLHDEYEQRSLKAKAMGGEAKLAARRAAGQLNARERVALLLDEGSFLEVGMFATSLRLEDREQTPADGKVAGFGRVNGREIGVVANDFTVKGASSSPINGRKIAHIKEAAIRGGFPLVTLGESTGARMPDVMGASGIGQQRNPTQYQRRRETPWISAVLGHCYGSASWYTAMSDFVVMRRGAIMAVSSPKLAAMATSEVVDPEDVGGWVLHTRTTGLVDVAVDTDEEAIEVIRRTLSYLPSHSGEQPPRQDYDTTVSAEEERAAQLENLVPVERTHGYDMRRVLACIFDQDSVLEFKAAYGRPITTALARLDGRVVGVIANNPMFKGGAIDADACSKATSFIVFCDSFNIPLITLVDQPGFLIGIEAERRAMPGRVMNWMNALSLCTVPTISIVVRKTYGQAVLNMGMGGNVDEQCAWTTAEISFMDPGHATTIVYGIEESDNPEDYRRARDQMVKDTSAYVAASVMSVQEVIEPRDTRAYLRRVLEIYCSSSTRALSDGLLRNWPTTVF